MNRRKFIGSLFAVAVMPRQALRIPRAIAPVWDLDEAKKLTLLTMESRPLSICHKFSDMPLDYQKALLEKLGLEKLG